MNESDLFWNPQGEAARRFNPYYDSEYNQLQNQQLDFQSFGEEQAQYDKYYSQPLESTSSNQILEPEQYGYSETYSASGDYNGTTEYEEPPLLEELEIYPDRILEKIVAVLNPFRAHSLADDSDFLTQGTDLAGPVTFCVILALCLFISDSKVYFGYIYGLSVMSCIMMYCLLSLMTINSVFTLASVTSILGYSLLPIVALSVLGVFTSLHGLFGVLITIFAVLWSSLSASRLFVVISGDSDQRPLIAYPCALVCGVFALLVIF